MLTCLITAACTKNPVPGLAKPFSSEWTDIITSPHLSLSLKHTQKRSREESSAGRGRLRTHGANSRHTERQRKHSPSARLVCGTPADNEAVCSLTVWRWIFTLSFTFMASFVADAGAGACEFLCPSAASLHVSRFSNRTVFFFCSRQDVARYWSASAPDAFTGCRTSHNYELNKGCHCRRQITYM